MQSTSTHKIPFANLFPRFRIDAKRSQTYTPIPLPSDTDNEHEFVAKYMLYRALRTCKARDDVYDVLITLAPLLFKDSSGEFVFSLATQGKGNLIIGWGTSELQQSEHVTYFEPIIAAGIQIGTLCLREVPKPNRQDSNSVVFIAEVAQMIGSRVAQLHRS